MRHWIFDFDGTLVESEGFFSHCLSYALGPFGVDTGQEFIERIRHKHPHNIFEDDLTPDQAFIAFERMREAGREIIDEIKIFPGLLDVLETLSSKGASLSIWTGRDRESTELILRKQGLETVFTKITTGTCVEINKPGHQGLLEIQNHHRADIDQMVMVGDHHHDIEPANLLGCLSVHARWKGLSAPLPETVKPNYQFVSTLEFHQWVKQVLRTGA